MPEKGDGRRRGRVEMRRVENPVRRQITLSKRKAGLLKKAAELSLLCDVDVALIIFSPSGKLYHSPTPNIDRALGRYQKICASDYCVQGAQDSENTELLQLELEKGKKIKIELERMQKHMNGEDLDCLSFKELQHLEQKMKIGVTKIRSRKERLLRKNIGSLKAKKYWTYYLSGVLVVVALYPILSVVSDLWTSFLEGNWQQYSKMNMREVGSDQNDLEGGPTTVRVNGHQQPHQIDGVASPQTNLQYHTNLSLSLF